MTTTRAAKLIFMSLGILAVLHYGAFAGRHESESSGVDVKVKEYNVKTADGWNLSINRYASGDGLPAKKAAVILCHGFNINNKFWDLDKRCSFARYLAENGYDVWAPSLRGSGLSAKPIFSDLKGMIRLEFAAIPRMLAKAPADITKLDWDIDDHIHKDMPAIIDFVSRESGFGKVYCIGHSMGSIIIFGYLEMENTSRVAGFISLSSMVVIPRPLDPRLEAAACEKQLLTAALLLNATIAAQLRNYTHGTVKSPIEELLMNKGNMEKAVVSSFFRAAVDDTSPGIMDQFAASLRAGRMLSADGKFDYTGAMHLVKTPILVAGGSADSIVAERGLKSTYEAVSSPDKSIVVFSKAGGYSTDYGHCDLILGRNSAEEVYPVLLRWLDERAARADSMTAEFQTLGGRKTGSSP